MLLLASEGAALEVAAETHEVYDVTGVGDTVAAVVAVALGKGSRIEPAVRLASMAAGIAVGRVGATSVTLEELQERATRTS